MKNKHPELEIDAVVANVREMERMDEVFRIYKPDIVYHAAAHKHVPLMEGHPAEAIKKKCFWYVECSPVHLSTEQSDCYISTTRQLSNNVMGY